MGIAREKKQKTTIKDLKEELSAIRESLQMEKVAHSETALLLNELSEKAKLILKSKNLLIVENEELREQAKYQEMNEADQLRVLSDIFRSHTTPVAARAFLIEQKMEICRVKVLTEGEDSDSVCEDAEEESNQTEEVGC